MASPCSSKSAAVSIIKAAVHDVHVEALVQVANTSETTNNTKTGAEMLSGHVYAVRRDDFMRDLGNA